MKQIFRALAVAVFLAAAGPVLALGLGKLEKNSSLNERFEGRIPLLSATPDELASLKVGLADQEAFSRAGINYAPVLRDLKFTLVEPQSGQDYIHVTSSQPIREPFLNFLVEMRWSSGRIYREYTVLLDPPLYDPNQGRVAASAPKAGPSATEEQPSKYSHTVIYPDEQPAATSRSAPGYAASSYSGGDYGPVQSGDTLWSIANVMKPDSVTTHQMMLALLRANPDAFIGNNINGLKRGAILRMPETEQMNAMSQSEALAQVKSQHSLWESARQSIAAAPPTRAETTSPAPAGADADGEAGGAGAETAEPESRLELVGADRGAAGQTGDAEGSGELSQQLAVANEKLESVQQENTELRDRLAENEALIEDLKRLIALKDDELASLQGRTAEEAAGVDGGGQPAAVPGVDGVNYPNGDPAQFIGETPPMGKLVPGPVPAAPEISHTVNQPQPATEAAPAEPEAKPEQAAPKSAAEAESARPESPAKTAARESAPAAAGGGIMGTIMGLVDSARQFVFNNLMIVAGAVLVIILLLAGSMFMRRRQQAQAEQDADAMMADGAFPDFAGDSNLDQTSFEEDSESATELNATGESSAAAEADEDATVLTPEPAAGDDEDEDLFVVPQGEAEPAPSAGDEEEEDPLAEVNVLMAYEHFDQAESFVRNALKSEPDNVEYQAKLLEVFYAAGNKKKYEEAASDLRDMTGGKGEHWDMAVAMWQEMSPNRALFEGGDEEEEPAEATGSGGIVDITGDTAGGGEAAEKGEGTGGGLDFDLGDSTGGGSAGAAGGEGDEMLDLTASDETGDDDMLDLTASSEEEDDGVLDLTAASSSEESFDETQTLNKVPAAEEDDNSLDFSLDGDGGSGSDLLDVTRSGEVDSDEDLLDVTAAGKVDDIEEAAEADEADDDGLDFSMDMEPPAASETESEKPGADDDSMLEFDSDFGLDTEAETAAGAEKDTSATAEDDSLDLDASDLKLDVEDDTSDTGGLDEIGEELDRLEQTLGTLSHQDATKGFGSNTSDALEGIDSALEEMGQESDSDTGSTEATESSADSDDDSGSELDISLGGLDAGDEGGGSDELDISLGGTETSEDSGAAADDLSDLSIELDSGEDDSGSSEEDISSELSDLGMEFESEGESDTGSDDISAELSELSKGLESGDLELGDEGEISLDSGDGEEGSMDFDLDTGTEQGSSDTVKMQAVDDEPAEDDGLDLDLSADDMSSADAIDMDSTVELPKEKLSSGLSLEGDEDGDEDQDQTVFVARSGDTEEQSLEDELTTKLDLAKAYVELGDSDSARGILEEVMQDGNDEQKRQAGELLQQL